MYAVKVQDTVWTLESGNHNHSVDPMTSWPKQTSRPPNRFGLQREYTVKRTE
ncbi:predicted protein [Plenodomus lingam JN3]|uniref:Predicted protein n=1 Tax=Leptosphaeria maculans (strain JN3 / isolate v23.1.3 / race Av1-4-5-6-7-8) TaxID=985895 RepID=E5A566_LEPMJ|nr:predicted protein [Plenodomus lingam JN3]CBX98764.1 predicted protein [Plenodomus lingam JN3]